MSVRDVSRTKSLGSRRLAHELMQPLTAILGNAQAAQHLLDAKRPDLREIREILGDIVRGAERAGRLIRQGRAGRRHGVDSDRIASQAHRHLTFTRIRSKRR